MTEARVLATDDARLRVEGVLDFSTVGPLAAEAKRLFAGGGARDIDLAGVTQANSAGVALLLEWLAIARTRQVSLRFHNLPAPLARIAQLTNVTPLLPVAAEADSGQAGDGRRGHHGS
jgi:phospholipid transport system transporter-binding protein